MASGYNILAMAKIHVNNDKSVRRIKLQPHHKGFMRLFEAYTWSTELMQLRRINLWLTKEHPTFVPPFRTWTHVFCGAGSYGKMTPELLNVWSIIIKKIQDPQRVLDLVFFDRIGWRIDLPVTLSSFLRLEPMVLPFTIPWNPSSFEKPNVLNSLLSHRRYEDGDKKRDQSDLEIFMCVFQKLDVAQLNGMPTGSAAKDTAAAAATKSPIHNAIMRGQDTMLQLLLSSAEIIEKLDLRTYFDDFVTAIFLTPKMRNIPRILARARIVETAAQHQRNLETQARDICAPAFTNVFPLVDIVVSYLLYAPSPTKARTKADFSSIMKRAWFKRQDSSTTLSVQNVDACSSGVTG